MEGSARRRAVTPNPLAIRRTAGEWAVDVVALVLALGVWALSAIALPTEAPAVPGWFHPLDVGLGFAGVVALVWARSAPLAVALVLLPIGTVAYTSGMAVLLGIVYLATLTRPRWSVPLTFVHIACAIPYHAVAPLPGVEWIVWLVLIPLLYLLGLSLGLLARARRLVIEGLRREVAQDRERHAAQLAHMRRAERERIAREMHDVLAHRLSLLSVHAGALEYRTAAGTEGPPPDPADVHGAASVIRDTAHLALEDLRHVLTVLRTDDEDPDALGLAKPQPRFADLPALLGEATGAGQRVESRLQFPAGAVSEETQRTVFRVVQEGLTNARKHAPGARVRVEVVPAGAGVRASVVNPLPVGVTSREIPGVGAGLAGLAERVRLAGGVLRHEIAGGEFRLSAVLPGRRP